MAVEDPKERWLRVALGVAAETLALLKAPLELFEDHPADAKVSNGAPEDSPRTEAKTGGAADVKAADKEGAGLQTMRSYVISIPPQATGKLPLLVIFAGNTGKDVVIKATPPQYFKKAIVVFGERNGKFSAAEKLLAPLLAKRQAEIGSVSICGFGRRYRDVMQELKPPAKTATLATTSLNPTIPPPGNFSKIMTKRKPGPPTEARPKNNGTAMGIKARPGTAVDSPLPADLGASVVAPG